jgi:putative ABC transport system substrate-binding protein
LAAELVGKQLELLHELVPNASIVALLVDPSNLVTEPDTINLQASAASLGLQARVVPVSTASEIEAAFENLVGLRAKGLLVRQPHPLYQPACANHIAGGPPRHAAYVWRLFPAGWRADELWPDIAESYRQLGLYAAKILKGEKPADLPVQQVVKVALVINLKTAKTLGRTIPPTPAGCADEVIE